MKIIIEQPVLKEALRFAVEGTQKKETIPSLSHALLETMGEGTLRVTCTDMDLTVKSEAEANVETSGTMCVHARKLAEIVNKLPDSPITLIREDNGWAKMTCLKSSYRIPGIKVEDFAQTPNAETATSINPEDLVFLLESTQGAMTIDISRFTLAGIKWEFADGSLTAIATDGFMMSIASVQFGDAMEDFLLPQRAVSAAIGLAKSTKNLSFGANENHIYFQGDATTIICRKLAGMFPNWKMIIPADNDKTAAASVGDLRSITDRLASVADLATNKGRRINLSLSDNELQMTAQSTVMGDGEEVVQIEYSDEPLKLALQSRFLIEALRPYESSDRIKMTFKDGHSGMTIEPYEATEGRTRKAIIHPLKM